MKRRRERKRRKTCAKTVTPVAGAAARLAIPACGSTRRPALRRFTLTRLLPFVIPSRPAPGHRLGARAGRLLLQGQLPQPDARQREERFAREVGQRRNPPRATLADRPGARDIAHPEPKLRFRLRDADLFPTRQRRSSPPRPSSHDARPRVIEPAPDADGWRWHSSRPEVAYR